MGWTWEGCRPALSADEQKAAGYTNCLVAARQGFDFAPYCRPRPSTSRVGSMDRVNEYATRVERGEHVFDESDA